MSILQNTWAIFADECIPVDAHSSQSRAMRVAFYAGAHTMLKLIVDKSAKVSDLQAELTKFEKTIRVKDVQ